LVFSDWFLVISDWFLVFGDWFASDEACVRDGKQKAQPNEWLRFGNLEI
jgi:hypothetical protein